MELVFGQMIQESEKLMALSPLIVTEVEGGRVSDRLGKLKSSSESWKNRVEQSDARKFTVAGRLQKEVKTTTEVPIARAPNPNFRKCAMLTIRSAQRPLLGLGKSPSMAHGMAATPNNEQTQIGHRASLQRSMSENVETKSNGSKRDEPNGGSVFHKSKVTMPGANARIIVPNMLDDEMFASFFASKVSKQILGLEDDSVAISDFDHIKPTQRLANKRTVQGPRGRRAARNPLKSLATRPDIASEYTEMWTGVADREVHRLKLEASNSLNSNLAAEARAGLASVEDFKAVTLKSSTMPLNQLWLPFQPLMLMHIKGRAHVQTRLVEPTYRSLNRGDCFILLADKELFRYVGAYANVIEIVRSQRISSYIVENRDMGCAAVAEVLLSDDRLKTEDRQWQRFWELLGKPDDYNLPECGQADEDDLFESSLVATNKVYKFQDDALVPYERFWGCVPRFDMLDAHEVFVFDFGGEMYVWNGKSALGYAKRAALQLSIEHFNTDGIDYSDCYINPVTFASKAGARPPSTDSKERNEERRSWCMLGKITQNMETALFKEKFSDWPEGEHEEVEKNYLANNVGSVQSLDGTLLYRGEQYAEPNFVLENTSLGRGDYYYDTDTMRHFDVITKAVDKWHIHEFTFDAVTGNSSLGHFYAGESYIVRWVYQISVNVRELSGRVSNRSTVGRDRSVYFCWQGTEASTNEKGTAALLAVELDKEKGAQMRVAQGEENSAFVRLFKPLLVQHLGRRDEAMQHRNSWRLYHVEGNIPEETILREMECKSCHLRSRASLLLIHGAKGRISLWHGCQSASHTRSLAERAALIFQENPPDDLFVNGVEHVDLETQDEGSETATFQEALGTIDRFEYASLMPVDGNGTTKVFDYTPRLIHFSSTRGVFTATDLQYALRCENLVSPYPFAQANLYSAQQPTIFMLDDGDHLWLWMGWWPVEGDMPDCERPTNDNRAGVIRWISERRAALETAVSYWRAKFGNNEDVEFHNIRGSVVWAGLEPPTFRALFPFWKERADVKEINEQDGRTDKATPIDVVLKQLTQNQYPLSVLKERPLPEGVDPTRLELYIKEGDFELALGIPRTEFDRLPLWKQTNLKKQKGLF